MSYTKSGGVSRLVCDVCPPEDSSVRSSLHSTAAYLRRDAHDKSGWRRDKLGRDVCPAHLKLKGARK